MVQRLFEVLQRFSLLFAITLAWKKCTQDQCRNGMISRLTLNKKRKLIFVECDVENWKFTI